MVEPSFSLLQEDLSLLCEDIEKYAEEHSGVRGVDRLLRKAKKESAVLKQLACGNLEAISTRVQGIRNNLNGLRSELDTASKAPDVLELGKRFFLRPTGYESKPAENGAKQKRKSSSKTEASLEVEVDVVACGGAIWIEVKHAAAGCTLGSAEWIGNPGHLKGLNQQAVCFNNHNM
jgi:hypothetical protein